LVTAIDERSIVAPAGHLTVVRDVHRVIDDRWRARAAFAFDASLAASVVVGTLFLTTGADLGSVALRGSLPLLWPLAVAAHGGYLDRFGESTTAEVRRLGLVGARLAAGSAALAYWGDSSLWLHFGAVTVPLLFLLSVVVRLGLRSRLARLRREGLAGRRVVAVGGSDEVISLAGSLSSAGHSEGLVVVGACLPGAGQVDRLLRKSIPAIAGKTPAAIARMVDLTDADAVIISPSVGLGSQELRHLIWALETSGTEVILAPGIADVSPSRLGVQVAGGVGLVHIRHRAIGGVPFQVKHVVDRVLGLLAMVVLSPFLVGAAAAVRFTSPGPVLFRQIRTGKDGRPFTMWKFRTMVVDAEDRQSALLENHDGNDVMFKMRQDPRVTPVGRLLRRFSLDELPQIFNVMNGDMSLVGPRPPLPAEVELYERDVHRRFAVKPGMTGLWQVSGRADLDWDDAVRLDLRYVDDWSLLLDAQILWRTCGTVLRGHGAY
jgi:exopolysaccharide biosynthesis polyprenyl glycosylphosphotransferase